MKKLLFSLFTVFAVLSFSVVVAEQGSLALVSALAHPMMQVAVCPPHAVDTDPVFCRQYPSDAVCQCNANPVGHGICARGVTAIFQALMAITAQKPPYTLASVTSACTTEHNRDPSVDPVQCSDAWTCYYDLNSGKDTSGNTCNFATAPTPNVGPCAPVPTV